MQKTTTLSRRHWILGSSVIVASGTLFPNFATGQRQSPDATKDLVFHTTDPRNGEPELSKLVQSWITPTKHFYVRSHAPNPKINPANFQLKVEGEVRQTKSFSLEQLKGLGSRETTATLTCAGNRRNEFNAEGKVGGVQWEAGAIGNATWAGVALADVLKQVEVTDAAKHVWFEGLDEISKGGGIIPFGGSIPIEKAMMADGAGAPLIAHTMNGAPLTADHGFPLRSLVPGYVGARSVKWLGKIVVSDRPSPNHYLATAYKVVSKTDPIDWTESGPIYRFPVNAAIATPAAKSKVPTGMLELTGYALPTGRPGCQIQSVMVSSNNGKKWTKAELTGKESEFCWQLWKAKVNVGEGTKELIVRARDTSGGFMPQHVPWNAKGYLQNSWYRIPING